jgi:tRNA (mo5U34)-methyltransferase
MGYRTLSLFGVDVIVRAPDSLTQSVRARFGRRRIFNDRKVMVQSAKDVPALAPAQTPQAQAIQERIRTVPLWYHTIDLGHGVATPGGFDHRPYLHHYPLPERLDGKRVLDVATFDGFWAFEFARRGAQEVVAIDLDRVDRLDLPVPVRRRMSEAELARPLGDGFRVCREILGLDVRREVLSVYELDAERLGTFDFVFVSDLLLHLMNPMKALQNICKVTKGEALVVETFEPNLPGELMEFQGGMSDCVWWRMSLGALEKMVREAGFASVNRVAKFPIGQYGEAPWLWHAAIRCRN